MSKRHVTLSVDAELIEEAKRRGINISREVNTILQEILYASRVSVDDELKEALHAKEVAEQRVRELLEERQQTRANAFRGEKLRDYRRYYQSKIREEWPTREEWLRSSAEIFGIGVDEFTKLMEEKEKGEG